MNNLILSAASQRMGEGSGELQYLGMVSPDSLISAGGLVSLVGLTAGTSPITSTNWLMFKKGNQVRYVSRGPMRTGISWDHLNDIGVVYGKEVVIGGQRYLCRLLRGDGTDPSQENVHLRPNEGEFNELFYSICNTRPSGYTGPILANLQRDSLGFNVSSGWQVMCQESKYNNAGAFLRRHTTKSNITTGSYSYKNNLTDGHGWWPVLELIG